MSKHKRRKRRVESSTVLVPLSMYQDEAACRLWIAWLERQLRKAKQSLKWIMNHKSIITD